MTRKSKKQQLKQVQQKLYSCQICDRSFSVLSKLRSCHQQCKQTADQQKSKQKAVTTSSAIAAPKSSYDTPKNNTSSTKTTNIFRCCGVSIDTIETMLEHCQENHSDEMINQNPKMCDKCDLIFPNNRIIGKKNNMSCFWPVLGYRIVHIKKHLVSDRLLPQSINFATFPHNRLPQLPRPFSHEMELLNLR